MRQMPVDVDVYSLLNICCGGHKARQILQVALLTSKKKENASWEMVQSI